MTFIRLVQTDSIYKKIHSVQQLKRSCSDKTYKYRQTQHLTSFAVVPSLKIQLSS